jgi:DNA-binding Lrp family transcriptional regulator
LNLNACLLIKTKPNMTHEVLADMRRVKGVRKAYVVYGRFDAVAFVEGPDYPALRELTAKINTIDGVRSTETLAEA